MKRLFFLCLVLLQGIILLSAQDAGSTDDFRLVTNIRSAEKVGYYPSVIVFADKLLTSFPNSMYSDEVLSAKGRALYYSGNRTLSRDVFLQKTQNYKDWYFLGRISYDEKKWDQAIQYFYKSLNLLSQETEEERVYYESILEYTGKSLYLLGEMQKLIPVYETLCFYTSDSYLKDEVVEILITAYQQTEQYSKTIALYDQLPLFNLSFNTSNRLTLKAGDAYAAEGNNEKAFDLYSTVLNGAGGSDLVIAMQKAYITAEKLGNRNIEELLNSASSRLEDYPSLISEFWIRLGIARFKDGEFQKALECFDTVSVENDVSEYELFYRAAAVVALNKENINESISNLMKKVDSNSDFYFQALLFATYSYVQRNDWQKALPFASEAFLVQPSEKTSFWYALVLLESKKFNEALAVLEPFSDTAENPAYYNTVYARALLGSGKVEEAVSLFETICIDTENLSLKENFAHSLITAKIPERVNDAISPLESPLASYLNALASYTMKNWIDAESLFLVYTRSNTDKKLFAYAQYYLAYSQYMQSKNAAAFETFSSYASLPNAIPFLWNSYYYSAIVALNEYQVTSNSSWLIKAEEKAALSAKQARNDSEKKQSLLLYADTLGERGKYDEALSLLEPYTFDEDEFALYALLYSADLYTKKKNVDAAASSYETLLRRFSVHPLAEQALYFAGDLFFKNMRWQEAAEKFTQYKRSYPAGLYSTAALNYCAESFIKDKNEGQAILTYHELLKNFPNNSYEYSAMMNLVQLYRNKKEYRSALDTATTIVKLYPKQAKNSTIQKQMDELALLISGEDEKIAVELASFTRNGKEKTAQGRISGFKLGQLYIASPLLRSDGAAMLRNMLNFYDNTSAEELEFAASAYFLLGSYDREVNEYENASMNFLKAAELYAVLNQERAAQSLYCAIESFDCRGLYADARSTYELLVQKFPQSTWVSRAAVLLRGISE